MKSYILVGDSGHCKVILDCIRSNGDMVKAILDDRYIEKFLSASLIKGPLNLIHSLLDETCEVIIAIGSNIIRKKIVNRLRIPEEKYGRVIHPKAVVSSKTKIGFGTVIMPGVVINADTIIGNHCIINSGSIIEHDNIIDDYVHISPNTTLTGSVKVGEGTQIGAGSIIIPNVIVNKWTIIGAGSTVINNIGNNVTAVGTPAKVIKKEGLIK